MITVRNKTSKTLSIRISTWGGGGNDEKFTLKPDRSETWGRDYNYGYIIVVMHSDTVWQTYYVGPKSSVKIENSNTSEPIDNMFAVYEETSPEHKLMPLHYYSPMN